ncbi:MAG: hypothetical protein ACI33P_12670 [Lysinibacillus sp.]
MHPGELISYSLAAIPLIILLSLAIVLRGKWKKGGFIAAGVYALVCILFFLGQPYYTDYRIEEKVELLDAHLEEKYPDETWTFWTVPHREDGYESMNPYIIEVTFETEPTVHYGFSVTEGEIKPVSYWIDNNEEMDLKHWK